MSNYAIQLDKISKQYQIGGQRAKYKTLRESISDGVKAPIRRSKKILSGQATGAAELNESFWALQDVSFNVNHGEVIGLIGRNGAGKSTLLKVLSRITYPTKGQAIINGRVGSLLEVGTGFHPELTGRENVYLNGAILGMGRVEIDRKFDEIVAFAEVEKFIDTPVKHYSSGMRVRLAFAVAAHFEPEILLVDEVLAVGDARFQRKCLNKLQDVGEGGRTVIFVSHNMTTITRLCDRAVLLEYGSVANDGPVADVVASYMHSEMGTMAARRWSAEQAPGSDVARLRGARIEDLNGAVSDTIDIRSSFCVTLEYDVLQEGNILLPNYHVYNNEGIPIFSAVDLDPEWRLRERPVGRFVSRSIVPGNLLAEGAFFVRTALITLEPVKVQFNEPDAVAFQVIDTLDGDSARGDYGGNLVGVMRPKLEWQTEYFVRGELD